VALGFMGSVIAVGFISYCIKISRGRDGSYKNILDGFLVFGKAVFIAVLVSVLTALWTLLFLFPGLIAFYRYRMAFYILLDDPAKGAIRCIRESKWMMKGNKLDLFLLDLSFIGWALLDVLFQMFIVPVPIVAIWYVPYQGLARAAYYNRLSGYRPEDPEVLI
jgi:uncharacterized membrane protein